MATFAIDFDHTICDTHNVTPPHKMGPPLPYAREFLTKLHEKGHTIIIHTCRANDGSRAIRVVEDWLKYFEIPFDCVWSAALNGAKPVADYYIDDKAIRFTSWKEVEEILECQQR